jgi:hypothetical protein
VGGGRLARVLLARKVVASLPALRVTVLAYSVKPQPSQRRRPEMKFTVAERLKHALASWAPLILFVIEENPEIGRRVQDVDGSEVYGSRTASRD